MSRALADTSLVIVNWNTRTRLVAALDSLVADAAGGLSVIVVDNASTDDSVAAARSHPLHPRVVVRPLNGGFSAGVNSGLAEAGARWIVLLNSDARVRPGAVERLVADLAAHPDAGVAGGRVVDPDGGHQETAFSFPTLLDSWLEFGFLGTPRPLGMKRAERGGGAVDWVSGAFMAFARETALRLGGFDERFFLYAEDIDFCRRVRAAGLEVRYVPDAVVEHEARGSEPASQNWSPRAVAARLDYHRKHDGALGAFLLRAGWTVNWLVTALLLLVPSLLPGGIGARARGRFSRVVGLILRAGKPA